MRRCFTLPARLLALLLVVVALDGAAALTSTPLDLVGAATSLSGDPVLRITSPTPELWPGHRDALGVRVTSAAESPATVRITGLTVTIGGASPECGAENVTATSYTWTRGTTAYTVAPGQTVVVPLSVTMVETGRNQDACQGATFPIRFEATTEPVG
jgi:hypothetical protein